MATVILCGCQTFSFYGQAIRGQYQMMSDRQPIGKLIAADSTEEKLKGKFELILELRKFAESDLALPTDGHYLNYVDLQRSNVVWNIYAADELSLEPKTWWYPVVGKLSYRGYFKEASAEKMAAKLRKQNYDVYVGGVDAYSTLGWFKDPVLNTFIDSSERRLASLIFHELAHQRLFVAGDTEFNEAFATAVGEEGVRRWMHAKNDPVQLERVGKDRDRRKQFVALILETRHQLQAVYESKEPVENKRSRKAQVLAQLRTNYEQLKQEWNGFDGYDEWFEGPVNNAQLNTISTYYNLVPAFHQLIQEANGDLDAFYTAASRLTKLSKPERHQRLAEILRKAPAQSVASTRGGDSLSPLVKKQETSGQVEMRDYSDYRK
ncbi:MAG: aminopeptidase [Verrucomicrobia bacterium]|nr:aminopeptidase [Verrucomicrobiota bacterium]